VRFTTCWLTRVHLSLNLQGCPIDVAREGGQRGGARAGATRANGWPPKGSRGPTPRSRARRPRTGPRVRIADLGQRATRWKPGTPNEFTRRGCAPCDLPGPAEDGYTGRLRRRGATRESTQPGDGRPVLLAYQDGKTVTS